MKRLLTLLIVVVAALLQSNGAAAQTTPAGASQPKLPRIGVAGIHIENSTFHPLVVTRLNVTEGADLMPDYVAPDSLLGRSAVWLPALRARGGQGIVSREAYEKTVDRAIEMIKANMPYDAFWFYIHGACSVEGLDDPEGEFLERIRGVIGNDALVSTTMDLHGNVSWRIAVYSDLITTYRMAPHDDQRESHRRGVVNLLERLSSGKGRPAYKAWVSVPILLPGERTSTRVEPAKSLYALVPQVEALPGVVDAGIWIGYAWADERRNGGVVMVVGDDKENVESGARLLSERFWAVRHEFDFEAPTYDLERTLDLALASDKRPFFISDMGDNPGGGGSGEVTWTLRRVLARPELQNPQGKNLIYNSMVGPEMIVAAARAGVGAQVTAPVGAMTDRAHGEPIELSGTVRFTDENYAVVRVGSVDVIVTRRVHLLTADGMRRMGLEPTAADIVMIKQGYLVPEWYEMQADWVMAHTRGGVDQDLVNLPYRRVIRPIYPLDPDMADPELNVVWWPSAKYIYGR